MIVDLSQFQGAVDWDALASTNPELVIIRAGFGVGGRDAQFSVNWSQAKQRGIKRIAYWFCYPAYNSPQAEAADFNSVVGPLEPGEGMAGDFENDPNARAWPANGLSWAEQFLTEVGGPDYIPGFYGAPSFLAQHSLASLADTWWMWIADWFVQAPDTLGKKASLWQFTDCASIAGVNGCVDGSYPLVPVDSLLIPGIDPPTHSTGGSNNSDMGFVVRDVTQDILDEVYCAGGEALWGTYPGGAGGWVGANTSATNLGSPAGAKDLVEVSGAFATFVPGLRLHVRGVRKDGTRWLKVMNAGDFSMIQDWAQGSVGPNQDVEVSGSVLIPHKHTTDTGTPS